MLIENCEAQKIQNGSWNFGLWIRYQIPNKELSFFGPPRGTPTEGAAQAKQALDASIAPMIN